MSCPAAWAIGPSWPQPVIRPNTTFGLRAIQTSGPNPSRSATPGRNPSMRPSADSTSLRMSATPSGCFRSTATDLRPRFIRSTCASWWGGYVARSKRSIRTMSAPASASIIPANGAGPSPASSMMRIPSSGPLTGHPPMTGRGGTGPARSGMGFRGRSWPDGGRRGPRGSNTHAAPRRPGAYLRATGRGPGSGSREHATEVVGLGPRTGRTAPVASPRSVRIADQPPLQPPRGADWCHRSDEPQDPDG